MEARICLLRSEVFLGFHRRPAVPHVLERSAQLGRGAFEVPDVHVQPMFEIRRWLAGGADHCTGQGCCTHGLPLELAISDLPVWLRSIIASHVALSSALVVARSGLQQATAPAWVAASPGALPSHRHPGAPDILALLTQGSARDVIASRDCVNADVC